MTSQRLFFALWPDDDVREALSLWQTQNLPPRVRWQHRDDLHMTLHFLGEVDQRLIPQLSALGERCAGQGFSLVLDRTGFWRHARVLWTAPTGVPEPLTALHRELEDGLCELGVRIDERPYRPHVTLARGLSADPKMLPLPPVHWSVREMALVESRRGPAPVYHPVARWLLSASPGDNKN